MWSMLESMVFGDPEPRVLRSINRGMGWRLPETLEMAKKEHPVTRDVLSGLAYWKLCFQWAADQSREHIAVEAIVIVVSIITAIASAEQKAQSALLIGAAVVLGIFLWHVLRAPPNLHEILREKWANLYVKKTVDALVLKSLLADVRQMKKRIAEDKDGVMATAGQILLLCIRHGMFPKEQYAALHARIAVAKGRGYQWQKPVSSIPRAICVCMISWMQQVEEDSDDDRVDPVVSDTPEAAHFGLSKLEEHIEDDLLKLEPRLRD